MSDTLNFLTNLPLDACQRNLRAITTPETDLNDLWRTESSLRCVNENTVSYQVVHLPPGKGIDADNVLMLEGMLTRKDESSTYVIGKLKGRFNMTDEFTLNEILVVLASFALIWVLVQQVLGGFAFGLAALIVVVGFWAFKYASYQEHKQVLLKKVNGALHPD
jgi:hypothetical protein